MDRCRTRIIFMFLCMLFPILVFADDFEAQVTINCPTSMTADESVECTLVGNSNLKITDVSLTLSVDDGLTFDKIDTTYFTFSDTNWRAEDSGTVSNNNKTLTVELIGKPDSTVTANSNFEFGKFKIKAGGSTIAGNSYNVSVNAKVFSDAEIKDGVTNQTSVTISGGTISAPTETGLKTLKASNGGTIIPAFDKDSGKYTWRVQLDSATTTKFKLTAEAANSTDDVSAKITGGAALSLDSDIVFKPNDSGSMSITITVGTGENQVVYTVIVVRPTPDNVGEPTLKSLMIGGKRVALVSGQFDYTVTLDSTTIKEYTVDAVLSDAENFKFKNTAVLSPHNMSGEQEFIISIIPKNEDSSYGSENYIITVKSAGGGDSTSPGQPSEPVTGNPSTGSTAAIIMGILLVTSFVASMYYYKKNISQYN